MKAKRQQYEEFSKPSRSSEPPAPTASRSSSLRNELLHSLQNSSKLQNFHQQQHTESIQIEDIVQNVQQAQPNKVLIPPPTPLSEPTSPINTNTLRRTSSNESNGSFNQYQSTSPRQTFSLSRLPTSRLALLTGSRKLISRFGQMSNMDLTDAESETSPECYLLDTPATLKELTIKSTDFLNGHILVCMHHKVSNIFKFIYNLRYSNNKKHIILSIDIIFI